MCALKTKTKRNSAFTKSNIPSLLDLEVKKLSRTKLQQKRYRLAAKLRKLGYTVNTKDFVMVLPYQSVNDAPTPDRYYIRQMIRVGFTHQLALFS